MITAHGTDGPELAVRMMKLGADDYVTKPFPVVGNTLDRAILEALQRRANRAPAPSLSLPQPSTPEPPAADFSPRPFTGGQMVFYSDRVELCGVKIISDRGTGQCMMVLDQLRRKDALGQFVRMSAEELAEAINATGGASTVANCVYTLRRNIIRRLGNHLGLEVYCDDVIAHDEQGYFLRESIQVLPEAGVSEGPETPASGTSDSCDSCYDDAELNERQVWILDQLKRVGQLRRTDVEQFFGVVAKTARRDLSDLVHRGRIAFDRAGRNGYYYLVDDRGS